MLAHFVAMLAYVGVCWPILRAMWAHLVAMLAYAGLMLTHVEPKDLKNGNSQKNHCKTQDILMVGGLFEAMLAHLGAMLAYLEGKVGHLGAMLGLCWPISRPILAHVNPSETTSSEKGEKMRRAQNTVKRGGFWRPGVSPAGGAAPLSYGEERTAVRQGHGQGAPGRI